MYLMLVLWPNGRGYTKVLPNLGNVEAEISVVSQMNEDPTSIVVTFLDPDVADIDNFENQVEL